MDAAHGADAAEVVAQEVDDHDVLAAIFFVLLEGECGEGVGIKIVAAGHCALHGASGDFVVVEGEEKLGREREDVLAGDV